jgi:hypothetical protein
VKHLALKDRSLTVAAQIGVQVNKDWPPMNTDERGFGGS